MPRSGPAAHLANHRLTFLRSIAGPPYFCWWRVYQWRTTKIKWTDNSTSLQLAKFRTDATSRRETLT